ncbi:signal peptidase II [Streptomyces sp. adm13(2018)]|uniref:signal peptidase II n=1 Tax=unclassified Streptomyces TaxID=2593676 RepID=UPI0011CD9175|nr:signal peptidase II [Streptomyces sp. adm13(2018)]MYS10401.1 signal peptidase II [Streptomyces sp. SID6041]TXS14191.1 signal peptidase II [Streptomyces sp. adm13(2018)]
MAEAERIIGTPDSAGAEEPAASDATPAGGTAAPEDGSAAPERPTGRRRILALFVVAVLAYLLDLGSKMLVVAELEGREPIRVIGDWLRFDAIRNPGAAFGMGEAFTIIFTCIAVAVIVVIIRLARKLYSLPWAIALGLLLGGALGNLTDRIFRSPGVFEGAVVDFIAPAHFAVFNLADSAIVCGGILIVILSFRGLDPDGTVHKD